MSPDWQEERVIPDVQYVLGDCVYDTATSTRVAVRQNRYAQSTSDPKYCIIDYKDTIYRTPDGEFWLQSTETKWVRRQRPRYEAHVERMTPKEVMKFARMWNVVILDPEVFPAPKGT